MNEKNIVFKTKQEAILEDLRGDILSGKYAAGEKLPTEHQLSDMYKSSRLTVSKVLSSLEHEGLISRGTRVGSVVLRREERKAALRLAGVMMCGSGHVFGELHSSLMRVIQKNHYFPVTIDIHPHMSHDEIKSELGTHIRALTESSPDFFAIDGRRAFPFEFLKSISSDLENIIFFLHSETDIPFAASRVLTDFAAGGRLGVEHLLEVGCENILFCVGHHKRSFENGSKILEGAKEVLRENGGDLSLKMVHSWEDDDCLATISAAFQSATPPDAVFAFADVQARRVQRQLATMGLEPGRDYKLLGYNDTPWAHEFDPPMSSMSLNVDQIAKEFNDLIANGTFRRNVEIKVPPRLVIRETTRKS